MGRTTRLLAPLALALLLAACSSGGRQEPGAPPGEPRFPRYTESIKQIARLRGSLGWGGVWIGSTAREVERAIGKRLDLDKADPDELCGYRAVGADILGQPLRLEFEGTGEEARLRAVWLLLDGRGRPLDRDVLVRALKSRFPDVKYLPSPHAPDLSEAGAPKPLYELGKDSLFWVDPGRGIYFGKICVD
jgi:hypothetical protein